jgi:hypothetical protein
MSLEGAANEENKEINPNPAEGSTPAVGDEGNQGGGEGLANSAIIPDAVVTEPSEEAILKFFNTKGRSVEKLDDLFVEKIKEVNPYADVNDELKQILAYNKETGRGVSDYFKLQENIDDRPLVDLALEKAAKEAGGSFSKEDLTAFLEDSLGVDLSGELTPAETIKLTKFVKDYRDQLKTDQEKYKTPLAKAPENNAAGEEIITLPNGQKVEKSVFEEHEKSRQTYLENTKVAVDSVASTSLKVEFDNNGTKEELTYGYDFDENDKLSMLALSEDTDQTIDKLFRTATGFDHQGFVKAIWRLDPINWEKEVAAIANKARAEAIESIMKTGNNVNFDRNGMPAQPGNPNVRIVPVKELLNR